MSRQSEGSLTLMGVIAVGVFIVAMAIMIVVGGFGVAAAVFVALLLAAAVGVFLYWAFRGGSLDELAPKSVARPSEKTENAAAEDTSRAPDPTPVESVGATGPGASAAEAKPMASSTVEAKPDPAPTSSVAAGSKGGPPRMDAPDGPADDLKKIKGVGPKLESLLNSMGFHHYSQIASWSASDVAWVDENLEGFKGRVTRDDWVAQARLLASGGDTEFSKRVDDGDVY